MKVIKIIAAIITGIGAILIGIAGIIYLAGYEVLNWFLGIAMLVLGVGLLLGSIAVLCKKLCTKPQKE